MNTTGTVSAVPGMPTAAASLVSSLRDHISALVHGPDNPLSCASPSSSPAPSSAIDPSASQPGGPPHAAREQTLSHSSIHLPATPHLRRTSSVPICAHSPETRAALAAIYDQLLDLVEVIHPHIFTDVITPLGSPMMTATPADGAAGAKTKGGDAQKQPLQPRDVAALMATVKDQRRLVSKSMLDLQVEKGLNKVLRGENVALKEKLVQIAAATEQEEEALTNRFLVRIEELHKEKAKIIEQVEREEEYITNQLQRKLAKLQREKVDMENQLEMEQEAIVNRLQKQLEMLRSSAANSQHGSQAQLDVPPSPNAVTDGSFPHRRRSSSTHSSLHDVTLPPPPSLVDVMRADIVGLKQRIHELERENENRVHQLRTWRDELLVLRQRAGVPVDDLFAEPLEPLSAGKGSGQGSRSTSQSRTPLG